MTTTAENKTKPAPRAFPVGAHLCVLPLVRKTGGHIGPPLLSFRGGLCPTRNLLQTTRDFSASVEMTLESAVRNETAPGRKHNDPTQTKINETNPTQSVNQGEK